EAARPSAPRTMSLWHWPEITPSIGCTWAIGVLLQAARAKQTAAVAMACFMVVFLVWLRAACDGARGGGMNTANSIGGDTEEAACAAPGSAGRWPAALRALFQQSRRSRQCVE
ncbi:MAG: hypothetical protein DI592_15590, partial [Stenotrophomonas maltophilia]